MINFASFSLKRSPLLRCKFFRIRNELGVVEITLEGTHRRGYTVLTIVSVHVATLRLSACRYFCASDAVGVRFQAEAFPFPGAVGGGARGVAVHGTCRGIGSGIRRAQGGVQLTAAAPLFRDRVVARAPRAAWPGAVLAAVRTGGSAVDGRFVTVVAFDSHQVQALPGPGTAGTNARCIRHSYNFTDTLTARFGARGKVPARPVAAGPEFRWTAGPVAGATSPTALSSGGTSTARRTPRPPRDGRTPRSKALRRRPRG